VYSNSTWLRKVAAGPCGKVLQTVVEFACLCAMSSGPWKTDANSTFLFPLSIHVRPTASLCRTSTALRMHYCSLRSCWAFFLTAQLSVICGLTCFLGVVS